MKNEKSVMTVEKILFLLKIFCEIMFVLVFLSIDSINDIIFREYTQSVRNNIFVSLIESNIFLFAYLIFVLYECIKKYKDLLVLKKMFIYGILIQIIVSIINVIVCLVIGYFFNNDQLLLIIFQGIYICLYINILKNSSERLGVFKDEIEGNQKKSSLIMKIFSGSSIFFIILFLIALSMGTKYELIAEIISIVLLTIYILKTICCKIGLLDCDKVSDSDNISITQDDKMEVYKDEVD